MEQNVFKMNPNYPAEGTVPVNSFSISSKSSIEPNIQINPHQYIINQAKYLEETVKKDGLTFYIKEQLTRLANLIAVSDLSPDFASNLPLINFPLYTFSVAQKLDLKSFEKILSSFETTTILNLRPLLYYASLFNRNISLEFEQDPSNNERIPTNIIIGNRSINIPGIRLSATDLSKLFTTSCDTRVDPSYKFDSIDRSVAITQVLATIMLQNGTTILPQNIPNTGYYKTVSENIIKEISGL